MKKRNLKILLTIFLVILLVLMISCSLSSVYALSFDDLDTSTATADVGGIQNIGINIISIISSVGMVVAVVVLMVLGVKYMIGSTEEKSKYKDSMMPFIVGALLLFAASGIAKMVYNAANSFNDKTKTTTTDDDEAAVYVVAIEKESTILDKYII